MKMKKLLSLMLTAAMSMSMLGAFGLTASAVSGTGTESDPYLVSNEDDFRLISDFPSAHFRLVQNIVLTGEFDAVGNFSGIIDGDGFIVAGFSGSGLIYTNEGIVKNLFVDIKELSGAFIDSNNGTIENSGILGGEVYSRNSDAGTFAKNNSGTIKNCFSSTKLTVGGSYGSSSSVGGFVGENNGTIENCLYTGHIYCKGTTANGEKLNKYVSPFVGDNAEASSEWINDGGTVMNCYYDKDATSAEALGVFLGAKKDSGGASGKSAAALKMQATYEEWNFDNVWAIDSSKNDGYPYLQIDRRFNGKAAPVVTPTSEPTSEPTPEPTAEPTSMPVSTPIVTPTPDASQTVTTDQGISITFGNTPQPQNEEITVNLNGSPISFDVPPQIINDRTMVPLRAIFEALGAEVEWNGEKQTILAVKDGVRILLQIGELSIAKQVDGGSISFIEIDTAPVIINERTLVPVRAIAESFDCNVDWNGEAETVDIKTSANTTSSAQTAKTSGSSASTSASVTCGTCGGSGMVTCHVCGGTGKGLPMYMLGQKVEQGCTACGSTGKVVCGNCGGSGKIK